MTNKNKNRNIAKGNIKKQPTSSAKAIRTQESTFSGPIPPPELLQGYDLIVPGAAERILSMAESESSHTQYMERTALDKAARDDLIGKSFAFIAFIASMSVAVIAVIFNAPWVAGIVGSTTIVSVVGAFIKSSRNHR